MIAKAFVPGAMHGDDAVLNLVCGPGTGKGAWVSAMRAMLGMDRVISLTEFDDRTEERIERALIVVLNEADNLDYRVLHRILGLTDEAMTVRKHYRDPYEAMCLSRFVFVATHPISKLQADSGWGRRYRLINGAHPGRSGGEQDVTLKGVYESDEELRKLFWWHMRADFRYLSDIPDEVRSASTRQLMRADDYKSFVSEWVVKNETVLSSHELYAKFMHVKRPRSKGGINSKDRKWLRKALTAAGYEVGRNGVANAAILTEAAYDADEDYEPPSAPPMGKPCRKHHEREAVGYGRLGNIPNLPLCEECLDGS